MPEFAMSAPAEFDRPVLYGVEVEVDCRTISMDRRGDIVGDVLSFWPSGDMLLDGSRVEISDGVGTPTMRHDPSKPWMKGLL